MAYLDRVIGLRSPAMLTRLLLALLFATVGLQAVPFGKIGVDLEHGSAFSASTGEFAVAPQPERVAKVALPSPTLPPPEAYPELPLRLAAPFAVASHDRFGITLPAPAIATLPYPPRAPPTA